MTLAFNPHTLYFEKKFAGPKNTVMVIFTFLFHLLSLSHNYSFLTLTCLEKYIWSYFVLFDVFFVNIDHSNMTVTTGYIFEVLMSLMESFQSHLIGKACREELFCKLSLNFTISDRGRALKISNCFNLHPFYFTHE